MGEHMAERFIGYFQQIHFPENDNEEWIPNDVFNQAKKHWLKSKNTLKGKDYAQSCNLLSQYFSGKFDREVIISHFAKQVADQDEDGWIMISGEDERYGLRKSLFENYDLEDYEPEDLSFFAVVGVDYRGAHSDGSINEDEILDSPFITIVAGKQVDLKAAIDSEQALRMWEEDSGISVADCFKIEVNDELTTYIDDDGYQSSGYSSQTFKEGSILQDVGESVEQFVNRLRDEAVTELQEIETQGTSVESAKNTSASEAEEKVVCPQCGKMFKPATIRKWGGMCGACHKKQQSNESESPTTRKLEVESKTNSFLQASVCIFLAAYGDGDLNQEEIDGLIQATNSLSRIFDFSDNQDPEDFIVEAQNIVVAEFEGYQVAPLNMVLRYARKVAKKITDPYLQKAVGLHALFAADADDELDEEERRIILVYLDEWGLESSDLNDVEADFA
jgi:Zn finger protein HypA/HybF involved in hydrogenase expression